MTYHSSGLIRRMADRTAAPTTNLVEYTVSELAFALKRTVEDAYGLVKLRGEISGYKGPHGSGHCYFTLKDENACIEAVIWRSTFARLKFKPEAGLEVVARGRVTTYPDKSKYQIVIDALEPAGVGALMALLEQRKKMLAAEGLFADARKKAAALSAAHRRRGHLADRRGDPRHPAAAGRPLPLPRSGVAGAGFRARPARPKLPRPSPASTRSMIGATIPRPDLIIVARGGGSLEDLWGFNEEIVARAVAASAIPLISAVGHETDWTIIDLVADWRAPTPTAAAERAVPVRADLLISVTTFGLRAASTLRRALKSQRDRFLAATRGLPRKANILDLPRQRFDSASARLPRALLANARAHHSRFERCASRLRPHIVARAAAAGRDRLIRLDRSGEHAVAAMLARSRSRIDGQAKLLQSLGYHNVLARGFSLVRDVDGEMVRHASAVTGGAALDIEFADGHVSAHADSRERKEAEVKPWRDKQGTLL